MNEKNSIRRVLIDQREENDLLLKNCRVEREIERDLRSGINDKLIKVIMGGRRCGKSVLAHRVLNGLPYGSVNFDDERLFGIQAKDLNVVLEALIDLNKDMKFILLDEIQNVEGWELFVNRLQRQGFIVVITGSNAHLLSRELATHLTGRHRAYEVYPYSFREYLAAHDGPGESAQAYSTRERAGMSSYFRAYFNEGGFPEISEVASPRHYLQALYDRTLTRDIAMRHGVRHVRTLKDIAAYVAANCGSKLSYKNVTDSYSLGSVHTAKNYISYLQDAYLFFAVESFSFKARERVRRPRKMYAIDAAMVRATVAGQENSGLLLENVVFIELLRRKRTVHYYADVHNRYEVDFVVQGRDHAKDVELIQVCADMTRAETRHRELRGLLQAGEAFGGLGDDHLRVLTMEHRGTEQVEGRSIRCIPVWEWLLESEVKNA